MVNFLGSQDWPSPYQPNVSCVHRPPLNTISDPVRTFSLIIFHIYRAVFNAVNYKYMANKHPRISIFLKMPESPSLPSNDPMLPRFCTI